jgi:hypothetical protein
MKAALEAWGMGHNAFHQGFARETEDPKIVAATMEKPGVVLKRPVGSKGPFQEKAVLPKDWSLSPPSGELPKARAPEKKASRRKARPEPAKPDRKQSPAAIISFEKEKARRERARAKEAAREEARQEKEQARREREAEKARAALERAEARHEAAMAAIEKERDTLDRRARMERERWDKEKQDLKTVLREAD